MAVVGWLLAGLAAQPAHAQVPRHHPELRGRDFRPDGAWRRRATAIREQRRSVLRASGTAALNAATRSGARVAGTMYLPIILVRPNNVAAPFTAPQYADLLFGAAPVGRPYSLRTFYAQLSNGALTLDGQVYGWWSAPQPNAYYEDGCHGAGIGPCAHPAADGGPTRLGELLLGALSAVDDGTFDWGRFDNDGPDGIPNSGDDDGYVDFVTFIHPDVDGACGTSHLWSHRWVMRAWTGGAPYATKTPRAGGPPGSTILVDDYILQSGVGGSTACTAGRIMPIGTVAHETGHAFGLPDLYDTDTSIWQTEGIGEWGLMGSGNYTTPDSPARFEAWSLLEMGWVTVAPIPDSRTITTNPVTTSDSVFYLPVDGRDEYFLLENRQALESDSALLNPVRGKAPGLLVWHIDNAKIASSLLSNTVNVGPTRGVVLVQADGANQLNVPVSNFASSRGDAGDPFPGITGNTRLGWQTRPRSEDNAGSFAGFMIDQIRQVAPRGAMSFRVTRRAPSVIAPDRPDVSVAVNGQIMSRFDEVLAPGDQVSVSAQDAAAIGDGRTGLAFTGWSNGESQKDFVLTASATKPDTLIAQYANAYRVRRVAIRGSGDLKTTSAIYHTGGYVPENTSITLEAVPAPGAQFIGWSGDTTGSNLLLTLTPQHPYDLSLDFTISSNVTIADAATSLVGGVDPGHYLAAGLDRDGNNDGNYDLADFLRFVAKRRGTAAPAVAAAAPAATPAKSAPSAAAAAPPAPALRQGPPRRAATDGGRPSRLPANGGNR